MDLKHKVTINVATSDGSNTTVLRGAQMKLPARILKILLWRFYAGVSLKTGAICNNRGHQRS